VVRESGGGSELLFRYVIVNKKVILFGELLKVEILKEFA